MKNSSRCSCNDRSEKNGSKDGEAYGVKKCYVYTYILGLLENPRTPETPGLFSDMSTTIQKQKAQQEKQNRWMNLAQDTFGFKRTLHN